MAGINFSGIASGIDGNSIIDATVESKKLVKKPIQKKIDNNLLENESLNKLREKLLSLKDSLEGFATFKGTAVSKNIAVSDESRISAAVSGEAKAGTVSFDVLQLAGSGRITFDNTFSSLEQKVAPDLTEPKKITISIGQDSNKETFEIEISKDTTISELAKLISEVSPNRIGSNLVNTGDGSTPSYKLMISGVETGTKRGDISLTVDSDITSSGIFSSYQSVQAKDARIRVDGIGILERSKNIISDVFPGISLELKQVGNGISFKVNNDNDKTAKRVQDLVTSINSIIEYVNTESRITRVNGDNGPVNQYGSLSRTRVDDQLVNSLRSILSQLKSNGDSQLSSDGSETTVSDPALVPADIGLTTAKDGQITFNLGDFQKALTNSPNKVADILQRLSDRVSATGGLINNYTTFDGIIAQSKKSNESENDILSNRLLRIDENIEKQRAYLVQLFSKLEDKVGKLNSTSSALGSLNQKK